MAVRARAKLERALALRIPDWREGLAEALSALA